MQSGLTFYKCYASKWAILPMMMKNNNNFKHIMMAMLDEMYSDMEKLFKGINLKSFTKDKLHIRQLNQQHFLMMTTRTTAAATIMLSLFFNVSHNMRGTQQCSWLRQYVSSWEIMGLILNELNGFFILLHSSSHNMALRSTQPLINKYQKSSWGSRAVGP
jgi:hypothetical protein